MTEVPENAVELAMYFEGFRSRVYRCPGGYWTIGFGSRCSKDHPPITREEGQELLARDLQNALRGTIRVCPVLVSVSKNWLGSIVDFTFNLGVGRLQNSTLRRKINAEDWDVVPGELRKWVFAGGKKLNGLVARREAEALFFS